MTVRERLEEVLDSLPEERTQEVLDFAEFLASRADDDLASWREAILASAARRYGEDDEWQEFARRGFARNFGEDEPEYTLEDVIRR